MGFNDFFGLTLGVQVALGAGYLAYTTAYAGLRKGHNTEDAVFISLAFGAIALLVFNSLTSCGQWAQAFSSLVATLLVAAFWRSYARDWWHLVMRATGVHREDGLSSAWDAIVQTKRDVGQLSVHTKSGRVLYLNDRSKYNDTEWSGLYLGSDGSIALVVEEEELSDGTTEERLGVTDAGWGTRLTYIPADEVERVNIRLK